MAALNAELAPFRILTGIEVDILSDGSLDQTPELLGRLDVVVGSVHSELRMARGPMTRRMVTALADPNLDVLGHCTGRMKAGRRNRPPSDVRRRDRLRRRSSLRQGDRGQLAAGAARPAEAAAAPGGRGGLPVAIDSDAHAPGQLAWLPYGCERAAACGVQIGSVVNALAADDAAGLGRRALRLTGRTASVHTGRPIGNGGDPTMSVARVTELSCTSTDSFEDAIRQGIERANRRRCAGSGVRGSRSSA